MKAASRLRIFRLPARLGRRNVHSNKGRTKRHTRQLISYFYLDEDGTRMTVVAIHPDSASMESRMRVAGPLFRRFADFIRLSSIEVYGELSDALLKQLRQKAEMLGSGSVRVQRLQAGFYRLAAVAS